MPPRGPRSRTRPCASACSISARELPDEAGQTPAALGELVRTEVDKWVPMIKKAGVTAN